MGYASRQVRTIASTVGGFLGAALLLVACGGSGSEGPATTASPSASTTSNASITAAPRSGTASTTSLPPSGVPKTDLKSEIIPAPDGYALSTYSDVKNGPISPAEFDQLSRSSGLAASLGFVSGYGVTYDSSNSADYIVVTLNIFKSASQAASYVSGSVDGELKREFKDEAPTQQAFSGIPGTVEVDGTKLGSDGLAVHDVTAPKGAMTVDARYVTTHVGSAPDVLRNSVMSQYSRI